MKCRIIHRSPGRIRLRTSTAPLKTAQADTLEYYLRNVEGVTDAKVYHRTGDIVLQYVGGLDPIRSALSGFRWDDPAAAALVPEHTTRELNQEYLDRLTGLVMGKLARRFFLPAPVRSAYIIANSLKYIWKGLQSLRQRKLDVSVLDATSIAISIIRGTLSTADSVMFLLRIGELLEEWTYRKSVADLAGTMALNVDRAWVVRDGQEMLVPMDEIQAGEEVVVRTGNLIPLDGSVVAGEATVNQASITGESMPVRKTEGSYVYAGTVVEEGECTFRVEKTMGKGQYDKIVQMIEESEKLKSASQSRAETIADGLVPYTLAGTAITYLLTRNITKTLAVLMVDFSCALKLAMPITVLSAMRESSAHSITVKGGKFLEAVADADTIVFDKTGTLTHAQPKVAEVVTFDGNDPDEMLRLAACLEEHYPHSMANAVVEEALKRGLDHEERHSKVEYIVAHGISSSIDGQKACIGSYHFIFEDEGVPVPDEEAFRQLKPEYSHLFLAVGGKLAAVICIVDPLREEAAEVIAALKSLGIRRTVMMTGDNERTARSVARIVGVDEYYSEVLPEDKANFIKAEHEAGRKVIMIGDGINDSPALSEADAGIAIADGAAIAREVADITIKADDLYTLVTLRRISNALMERIQFNYRFIIGFNFLLIVLGVTGIMQPTTSAVLHNGSTLGLGMRSMTDLLKTPEDSSIAAECRAE